MPVTATKSSRSRHQPSSDTSSMWDEGALAASPQARWPAARRRYELARGWTAPGFLLDLGAGTGWLTRAIGQDEVVPVALDGSVEAVACAKALETPRLLLGRADALPFKERSFACVVTVEMLEHTEDPDAVLAEVVRVLQPDGRLVVTVPNGRGLYALLVDKPMAALAARPTLASVATRSLPSPYLRSRLQVHLEENMRVHHESDLTVEGWSELFSRHDLVIAETRPTEVLAPLLGVIFRLAFARSHHRFVAAMERVGRLDDWLVRRAPLSLSSGLAFLLLRK